MKRLLALLWACSACVVPTAEAAPPTFHQVPLGSPDQPRRDAETSVTEHRPIAVVITGSSLSGLTVLDGLVTAGFRGEGAAIYVVGGGGQAIASRYAQQLPEAQWHLGPLFPVLNHLGTSALPAVYGVMPDGTTAWRHLGVTTTNDALLLRLFEWTAMRSPPDVSPIDGSQLQSEPRAQPGDLRETIR